MKHIRHKATFKQLPARRAPKKRDSTNIRFEKIIRGGITLYGHRVPQRYCYRLVEVVAATQAEAGHTQNMPDWDPESPPALEDHLTNSHSPASHAVVEESKLGMGPATPTVLETMLEDFHLLVSHVVVAAGHRLGKDLANPIVVMRVHSH